MRLFFLLFLSSLLSATSQEKITYEDHIFPIFEQSCLNCHNPDKKKGDLDLSTYPALMAGGSGGKVAQPGDGASSKLYTVTVGSEEPVMPPEGDRIERKAADLIRAWIDDGMLETRDSKAKKTAGPKFDLAVDSSLEKPSGPPPMPSQLSLDPSFIAPRADLVKAMSSSPWAPLIALTGQKQILFYHSETFRFLGSLPFPKGQPESLAFHPSGKYLLASGGVAGKSGTTIAWDIISGKELFTAGREFDSVLAAAFTPDLSTVAMGGPSRLLKIRDTRQDEQLASVKKHTDWITALASSPNGKFFASGDRDGGIHVWDRYGNEIHSLRDHSGGVTALAFRSDSKLLASTSEDGQLIIWDIKKGAVAKKIKAHNQGATALHYHRDGHLVTAGRDRVAKLFQPDFKEKQAWKNLPEVVTAVALSHDAKTLFAGDFLGQVTVYDTTSNKKKIATLESNPPTLAARLQNIQQMLTQESEKRQKAESALQAIEKKQGALRQRIDGTEKALSQNEKRLLELNKKAKGQEKKHKQLTAKTSSLKKKLKESRELGSRLSQEEQELKKHLAKLETQKEEAATAKMKLQDLVKRRNDSSKREKELSQQWTKLNEERNRAQKLLQNLRNERGEVQGLVKAGKGSLAELEKQLPALKNKLTAPKKALAEARQSEETLREELAYWEEAQQGLQSSR